MVNYDVLMKGALLESLFLIPFVMSFLGVFLKLQKVTVGFSLSICLHETVDFHEI